MTRRRLALLGAVVLVCAGLGVTARAVADPVSGCTVSKGVLVVVDFRHFGESIRHGCDTSPTSGYEALHAAGFSTAPTQHDGNAFICRINDKPTPEQDPCIRTPPATAYWSYWHADRGQTSWTYSNRGAQASSPGDGSVDAWVFGATDVGGTRGGPCFTPAEARTDRATSCASASATRPEKTKPRTNQKSDAGGGTARTASPKPRTRTSVPASGTTPTGSTTAGVPAASSSAAAPGQKPTATTSGATATPPDASGSVPAIVDATPVSADSRSDSGSALPIVLVAALVLILGGGAGWTVLRRRRAEADL